jgi:hypothetical protein
MQAYRQICIFGLNGRRRNEDFQAAQPLIAWGRQQPGMRIGERRRFRGGTISSPVRWMVPPEDAKRQDLRIFG